LLVNKSNRAQVDVIIIGGGPAGLSAALWCRDLGMSAILFEGEQDLGGQLLRTFNAIENLIGIKAANGSELRDRFISHLESLNADLRRNAAVTSVDLVRKIVTLSDSSRYTSSAIIIATGVRRRRLGIAGEAEFRGRGVLDSGVQSKDQLIGKKVVIVGGGDAAIENAILLSENASSVTVVHRRKEFAARTEFLERAKSNPKIRFLLESEIREIRGDRRVAVVEVYNANDGTRLLEEADAVLIRVGVDPNTEIFRGQISLDPRGYVVVDSSGAASELGIFAAGDVSSPLSPTISTAIGGGATAAKGSHALINGIVRV
jgi:thioredoxin reductase (NADPH)